MAADRENKENRTTLRSPPHPPIADLEAVTYAADRR